MFNLLININMILLCCFSLPHLLRIIFFVHQERAGIFQSSFNAVQAKSSYE